MVESTPPFPQGSSAFKRWAQWVHRSILAARMSQVPGSLVNRTTRGVKILTRGGGGSGLGGGATRFLLKSVHGDYLVCHTFDGTNEGVENVKVAKAPNLRHSLTSQSVGGITITYVYGLRDYYLDGARDSYVGATKYQQEIVLPVYQNGGGSDSEIWADQPEGGVGTIYDDDGETELSPQPTWMDTNRDARAWYNVGMNIS